MARDSDPDLMGIGFVYVLTEEEDLCKVGALHFEAFISVVCAGRADIVKDAGCEKEMEALSCGPRAVFAFRDGFGVQVDADAVVEDRVMDVLRGVVVGCVGDGI